MSDETQGLLKFETLFRFEINFNLFSRVINYKTITKHIDY